MSRQNFAKEINKAVRVLGPKADPAILIPRIKSKYREYFYPSSPSPWPKSQTKEKKSSKANQNPDVSPAETETYQTRGLAESEKVFLWFFIFSLVIASILAVIL